MSDDTIYNDETFCQRFLEEYLAATIPNSDLEEKGAFTSKLCEGDQTKQKRDEISSQLVEAIARVQPKEVPEGVVPKALPEPLKAKGPDVTVEELRSLYDVEEGMSLVSKGTISALDLLVLHLRSFRNIIEYDLMNYEALYGRYCRVFSGIFTDLLSQLRGGREISQVQYLTTLVNNQPA